MSRELRHEIERRFLVTRVPPRYRPALGVKVEQGYLAFNDLREVRVRKKGRKHYLTVKVGEGLVRKEVECVIPQCQFDALWPMTEGRRIAKVRYAIPYRGYTLELDVFHEALELITDKGMHECARRLAGRLG